MTGGAKFTSPLALWILPGVFATWLILLGFGFVLKQRPLPQVENNAIEAKLVEVHPTLVGGLQGNGSNSIAPPKPASQPVVKHKHIAAPRPPVAPTLPPPVVVNNPASSGIAIPSSGAGEPSGNENAGSEGEGGGGGGGGGLGTDSVGARAIYAPTPTIPDELREDSLQTEAVAHFAVAPDGAVTVTLTKPTRNPRLNQILLETLKQWKFFPAVKDGIAINSVFDVRIPISIQ